MTIRNFVLIGALAAAVPLTAQAQPPLPPRVVTALKVCETSTAPVAPVIKRLEATGRPLVDITPEFRLPTQTMKGLIALAKQSTKATRDGAPAIPLISLVVEVCLVDQGIPAALTPAPSALETYFRND